MLEVFKNLDQEQLAAVKAPDGLVTVVAGAGTGKTTTLTARIGHLIRSGRAAPEEIMAVTFTNHAAREIRKRVALLVGEVTASRIRIGTFHSSSIPILRRHYALTGLESNRFSIVDQDDSEKLFKAALANGDFYPGYQPPEIGPDMGKAEYEELEAQARSDYEAVKKNFLKQGIERIQRWKQCGLTVEQALEEVRQQRASFGEALIVSLYQGYQEELRQRSACDFADLILKVVALFRKHPDILTEEARTVRHLLVDEFQDTDMLQAEWVRHITSYWGNLFAVGDVDQSLYSFRAAAPGIMGQFRKRAILDVTLKNNRRCTAQILAPANRLVDLNDRDAPKVLKSSRLGSEVVVRQAAHEFSEANMIGQSVKDLIAAGSASSEIAILVRATHLMGPIEKALIKMGVRYTLVGGKPLMQREEIRDMIAYLKLAINPNDDLAFDRIINKPLRGMGPAAAEVVLDYARRNDIRVIDACRLLSDSSVSSAIRKKAQAELSKFSTLIEGVHNSIEVGARTADILQAIWDRSGYEAWLKAKKDDFSKRAGNVHFLIELASEFDDPIEFMQDCSAMLFEEEAPREEGVRLSTIHAAKGLEFDHVFLPGWEQGILPSGRAIYEQQGNINDPWIGPPVGGCEEERRVAHVALTRARHTVSVSFVKMRGGARTAQSQFIREAGFRYAQIPEYGPAPANARPLPRSL